MKKIFLLFCLNIFVFQAAGDDLSANLELIRMKPGFSISLYAEVTNARSMVMGDEGTVFVGTRKAEHWLPMHME